jgi:hypothetical protein
MEPGGLTSLSTVQLPWAAYSTLDTSEREETVAVDALFKKIQSLSAEKAAEVEDFVDFLRLREDESRLTLAAIKLSEQSFAEVWDNPEDAVYDEL